MLRSRQKPILAACIGIRLIGIGFIGIGMTALLPSAIARACPGCKEAAFEDPDQARVAQSSAKGYGITVGLMLLIPVTLIGSIALGIARSAVHAKSKLPEQQSV